jgi:CheY-like chemotaxis protein
MFLINEIQMSKQGSNNLNDLVKRRINESTPLLQGEGAGGEVVKDNYKILLADDEPQNIRDLFEVLNAEHYRLFVASNGKSAVEQAIIHQPDAIIMDWDMPEMDGMEAIKRIKDIGVLKDIPIIVATGKMTSVENLQTALDAGATDYIRKPFDPIEIQARVNSMIRLRMERQRIAM